MFDLLMLPDEILTSYRDAKDKKKQISILADMNCTSSKEIRNWLISQGIRVPEDRRFKDTNITEQTEVSSMSTSVVPQTNTDEQTTTEVPESIRRILNERRIHLITQIKKLQAEVDDINAFIGEYRKE